MNMLNKNQLINQYIHILLCITMYIRTYAMLSYT